MTAKEKIGFHGNVAFPFLLENGNRLSLSREGREKNPSLRPESANRRMGESEIRSFSPFPRFSGSGWGEAG
jgi:hypothetical protein